MKKRTLIILALCVYLIGIVLVTVIPIAKVPMYAAYRDAFEVRMPGDYENDVEVLYNDEYATYTEKAGVISLKFDKDGYYYLKFMGDRYIVSNFPVVAEDNEYEIDLIEREYSIIAAIIFLEQIPAIVILSVAFVIFILCMVVAPKIKNRKKKAVKLEVDGESF